MSCIESRYEMRLLCKWSNSVCCALHCVNMIIVASSKGGRDMMMESALGSLEWKARSWKGTSS